MKTHPLDRQRARPEGTLTRRGFLAAGGSLAVGFSLGATLGDAAAAVAAGKLGVDSWVTVTAGPNNGAALVTVYAGKVELGTGIQTALMQIVADELYVGIDQVAFVQGDTSQTPGSKGYTAGSKTVQTEGPPLRIAAATAFQNLLQLGAAAFGVSTSQLVASAGRMAPANSSLPGKSYGELIGSQTLQLTSNANVAVKSPANYTVVGQSVARLELPDKFTARFIYSCDVVVPGMLHARVVRPSGRNANFASMDSTAAASVPGFIKVVRQGNFVAVVANDEYAAAQAARALQVTWTPGPALIVQASLPTALKDPANVYASDNEVNIGNVDTVLAVSRQQIRATYFTPFHMHGAMGAACSVASVDTVSQQATVWSGTQGPYPLRDAIAVMLGYPAANVRVIYTEASGCYGHNPADDVSAEAALISKLAGAPVRLQWTRAEEHGWEPLGPAMLHELRGAVAGGNVSAWQHAIYTPTHNTRPSGTAAGNLLPYQQSGFAPADMPALGTNTGTRNGPVTYVFSNNRLIRNFVSSFNLVQATRQAALPLVYTLPRSTALRSLGGFSNTFANESFMDELARLAGADPLAFRLRHLSDPRAIGALQAVAAQAGWGSPLAAAPSGWAAGRGIAYLRYETVEAYVATVVELWAERSTGNIKVQRVVVAHDCGLIINPDGLRNQIEGNVIQGISRTLKEQVSWTADRITTLGWQPNPFAPSQLPYPVINFDEVPRIETVLINQPNEVAWGAGEPVIGSIGGAIGNAVFNALGVRVRSLPMTGATVLAASGNSPLGGPANMPPPR